MSAGLSQRKFLVVDDQLLVRTLVTQVLRTFGVRQEALLQAADGNQALHVLAARHVDLVLCDQQMSPVNGLDLLKAIRCGRTCCSADLPFVFLSGHPERSTIMAAANFHADGFIIKPPRPNDIEKNLLLALERSRPAVDPFRYLLMPTGTDYDQRQFPVLPVPKSGADLQRLLSLFEVDYELESVSAGDILARALTDRHGRMLLPQGLKLQGFHIETLRKFAGLYGIEQVAIAALPLDQMIMYQEYYGIEP